MTPLLSGAPDPPLLLFPGAPIRGAGCSMCSIPVPYSFPIWPGRSVFFNWFFPKRRKTEETKQKGPKENKYIKGEEKNKNSACGKEERKKQCTI